MKCRELHSLAFLQWRIRYPNHIYCNHEAICECIVARIDRFKKLEGFNKDFISAKSRKNGVIGKDFLVKYDICDEYKPFLINSFQTIGWSDPFPDDIDSVTGSLADGVNLKVPEHPLDYVYEDSRYCSDYSPMCIYVPKKEVMLKMMRGCISIKDPEELWFHCKH